jgi:hypothetical protein
LLSAKSFASPLPIPDVAPIIIAFFILNFVCLLCRPTMRHNVFGGLRSGGVKGRKFNESTQS